MKLKNIFRKQPFKETHLRSKCEMNFYTAKIFIRTRANILVHGILTLLIGACFVSTVIFWEYVAENSAQGRAHNPAPYSLKDGHRQLKSLERILQPREVAGLFALEPQDETGQNAGTTPPPVPFAPVQACYSCSNNPQVCPELNIPSLIGEKKPNSDDKTMKVVEENVLKRNISSIRAMVEIANKKLQKHLQSGGNKSKELLDPLVSSETTFLIGNYRYLPGGHWIPNKCLPRWKVAVIIPFRNRSHHLPVLLNHLVPFLQRQQLEFGIYIIEQANDLVFNRAMLMNVGYLEALNFTKWDCFIFHDVDHLPKNDRNYYGCSAMPRHFLSGSDRWKYKLPYDNFFGAVTGLTDWQIKAINGFPNVYWGWGGEDDEIWNRCKETGLEITRVKGPKGHYDVITHHHHSAPPSKERMNLLKSFKPRFKKDGLVNLVYERPIYTLHTLYTNVSVNIQRVKGDFQLPKPDGPPAKKFAAAARGRLRNPPKPVVRRPPPRPAPVKKVQAVKQPVVVKNAGKKS